MASHAQLRAGESLAAYRIEALVGRGGMGEVYESLDTRLRRRVALKLLAPDLADDDRFRERFLRESRLAASLDHPNVLPIYEAGEDDGRLFIAMRFVEGTDLRRILTSGAPLEPERALALLAPVAGALDAAHGRGLVHRDVKPANILIARGRASDPPEHVYLSDFGLSTTASQRDAGGVFTGTADYAAPELVTGGRIDGRTDVYALGCVLFEALTGEPPYRGDSVMAVLWGHVNDPVPSASARNPALSEAADRVLGRALAKDPAKRYATCRALVAATGSALGVGDAAGPGGRRRLPLLLGAGVAIAVAAVAYLATRGQDAPERAAAGRDAIVRVDPATNEVVARVAAGPGVSAVSAGGGAVWATDARGSAILRLDPASRAVRRSPAHGAPSDVAAAGAHAVAANGVDGTVAVFDAASGGFEGVVQLGGFGYAPASVASDGRWAWVVSGRRVVRVNLLTLTVSASGSLPVDPDDEVHGDLFAEGVAVGEGAVWVSGDALNPALWRIDPARPGAAKAIALPAGPDAVAVGSGSVWVANQLDDSVTRVDARTGAVGPTIAVGREPVALAVGDGAVWVANRLDATVSRIDPATDRVVATLAIGGSVEDVAVGARAVWIAAGAR
jgi:YVTN family beta-propeller protein